MPTIKHHSARWLSIDNVLFTDLTLAARNARLPNTDSSRLYTWWNIKSRLKVRSYKLCSPTKPNGHISTNKLQIALLVIENVLIDKLRFIILLKSAEWMNAFNHRWPQIWSPRKQCANNTPRRQRPEIFLLIFAAINEWMNEDSHSAAS